MLPLPTFRGRLDESWDAFEARLFAWFAVHRVHVEQRRSILLLALPPPSEAAAALDEIDAQLGFDHALVSLRSRFCSELRRQQTQLASQNALDARRFRDDAHRAESVSDLVDELRLDMHLAGTPSDVARREVLIRAFSNFGGCQSAVARSRSFEEAVVAALRWEAKVISLLPTPSPAPGASPALATIPLSPVTNRPVSFESLADPGPRQRASVRLSPIKGSPAHVATSPTIRPDYGSDDEWEHRHARYRQVHPYIRGSGRLSASTSAVPLVTVPATSKSDSALGLPSPELTAPETPRVLRRRATSSGRIENTVVPSIEVSAPLVTPTPTLMASSLGRAGSSKMSRFLPPGLRRKRHGANSSSDLDEPSPVPLLRRKHSSSQLP